MTQVLDQLNSTERKYAIGVFIDVAGAFDTAWWPRILVQLHEFGITGKEYGVIRDYFRDRYAVLRFRDVQKEKMLSMGCPQGLVLGPTLWIVLFDSLLRQELPQDFHVYAYADNRLLLVLGNTTREIERKANNALERIRNWCTENRLEISAEKTKCMMLKGQMMRKPVIKLGACSLEYVTHHSYLGVILDDKLSFKQHLVEAAEKATALFYKVRRGARAN